MDRTLNRDNVSAKRATFNKSWKDIRKELSIPKSTFEKYKSGKLSLPEDLFFNLTKNLDDDIKNKILEDIEMLSNNFGQIKGGKISYSLNSEKFKDGRNKGIISITKNREKKRINFDNMKLTPKICEFIGAFIGDGCFNIYKNKVYHIEFSGDIRYDLPYYKEHIIPTIQSIFPKINPHIKRAHSRENAMRIIFYSKDLFYFLKDFIGFTPGKKAHSIYIPNNILNSRELLNSTIRGIFDTDGGVFLDKRKSYRKIYPRISFYTVSSILFNQIYLYLSKEFNLYKRFDEKRQIYIIEIYGNNQLHKWMSLIGFSNKRHLNKVALVAQSVRARHW